MKLAHLILAHAMHPQLQRLVKRLQHPDAHIYIHIDKKADTGQFNHLLTIPGVFFIENRVLVTWGDYNMVQATLNSFQEILATAENYSHINLLSSQDYPLKPTQDIHSFLFANTDKTFIRWFAIPQQWDEPLSRLTKYSFGDYDFPAKHRLQALANTLLPARKMPKSLQAYGRSQWFTITPACALYVINYLNENKNVQRFFRMTWAPDELVFQTILVNSPLKNSLVNNHLRYIKFTPAASRPKTLTIDDAYILKTTDKLFARKFDLTQHEDILNYLDNLNQ
jgi:hypothetical protein